MSAGPCTGGNPGRRTRNRHRGRGPGALAGLATWRVVGKPIRGTMRRGTFYSPTKPLMVRKGAK